MSNLRVTVIAAILAEVLTLAACATTTTKVVGTWKDDHYDKKISKVLVVSLAEEAPIRQKAEAMVAAKLRDRGIDAVTSSTIMPLDSDINRETVAAAIAGKGFDSVLVTRLLGVDLNTGYVPPDSTIYNFTVNVTPGYTAHRPVVSIRIDLYETGQGRLVWSMTTQHANYNNVPGVIDAYSSTLVSALAKQGLI